MVDYNINQNILNLFDKNNVDFMTLIRRVG